MSSINGKTMYVTNNGNKIKLSDRDEVNSLQTQVSDLNNQISGLKQSEWKVASIGGNVQYFDDNDVLVHLGTDGMAHIVGTVQCPQTYEGNAFNAEFVTGIMLSLDNVFFDETPNHNAYQKYGGNMAQTRLHAHNGHITIYVFTGGGNSSSENYVSAKDILTINSYEPYHYTN